MESITICHPIDLDTNIMDSVVVAKPVKKDLYAELWAESDCKTCHSCRTKKKLYGLYEEFKTHPCVTTMLKKKMTKANVNTTKATIAPKKSENKVMKKPSEKKSRKKTPKKAKEPLDIYTFTEAQLTQV